jgi:putative membrane protein
VQVLRTVFWVMAVILILLFILFNVGNSADLNIWPKVGEEPPVIVAGPIWAFALGFFVLGFAPMWLLKRAQAWRLKRRIASLENSLRAASAVAPVAEIEASPAPAPPPAEPDPAVAPSPTPESSRNDVP